MFLRIGLRNACFESLIKTNLQYWLMLLDCLKYWMEIGARSIVLPLSLANALPKSFLPRTHKPKRSGVFRLICFGHSTNRVILYISAALILYSSDKGSAAFTEKAIKLEFNPRHRYKNRHKHLCLSSYCLILIAFLFTLLPCKSPIYN